MNLSWNYGWVDASEHLHFYGRWRYEPTLDGTPKPYAETLAYIMRPTPGQWRVMLHQGEKVTEFNPGERITSRMAAVVAVENYFAG
ncbi:hypothetical protein [Dyadobacter helix]|uniref:hypothetical protein n=1 Tax=Dyadobacter helix TaxID=2822344 RepID=UPI001BFC8465|nr:hypothetical protein [Dyadobacter sp. CECT 9275]